MDFWDLVFIIKKRFKVSSGNTMPKQLLTARRVAGLVFALSLFTACNSKHSLQDYTSTFTEAENTLFKIKDDQPYTFGYLEVPENRSIANSKTIKLPVYIFKSRSANPKPDPIIYTVGGPGGSTMPNAPYMQYYRYLDDRDFILFEQRGTQYAQPHLDCPEWAEAIHQSKLPGVDQAQSDALLATAVSACRERLVNQNIDLNGYNTREIAADIADLRKVLGIEEYNLLTISYSTKIAQVLLRDHPEGIRSVVMDSALPLEVSYDEESVGNLLQSLDQLLSDCATDADCHAAFPNLKQQFFEYLRNITATPLPVAVDNPATNKADTFYLQGKDMIGFFADISTAEVPIMPREIWKVINGDLSTVKAQLTTRFEEPGRGNGQGMRLSVWCAEEFPFVSQGTVAAETNRYPFVKGLSPVVFTTEICRIWQVAPEPAKENEPVRSDIPVLLINGGYDYDTPPKWATAMQQQLPNSFHFVFKGWKHVPTTYWSNPCGMELANIFFNDPFTKPVVACFDEMGAVSFSLD